MGVRGEGGGGGGGVVSSMFICLYVFCGELRIVWLDYTLTLLTESAGCRKVIIIHEQ